MTAQAKKQLLSGNEALGRGAWEAGLEFAAAYPGTPSTEILEHLSTYDEVNSQWSVNEKVAYEVAYSACLGGVRSLFAAKHVGINVAMDPIMSSAYMGVNAGFVVVSSDDPGLHSSQNEQDNRLFARSAKMPLLEPSTPREAREFVKCAFEISEEFDIPVFLRMNTRISHSKEDVTLCERSAADKKAFEINPQKYVMVPKIAAARHIDLEERLRRLKAYAEKSPLNRIEKGSPKIGFVSSGTAYLYTKEMYPDASFLKLGMSFPFPDDLIREFAAGVDELYVIEELEPFLEEHIRSLGIKVKAKGPSFLMGELKPELIPQIVEGKEKSETVTVARKPLMCAGCSHRPVFHVLKQLKLAVAGDIGCYTLAALPPLSALHTCLCMGGGVTFSEGLGKTCGRKVVGVVGDSTFVHSGITGLINAAYNKHKGLVMVLDNSTTAMTGTQPNPATGITIKGEKTKRLDLAAVCRAAGADNVDVVDSFDIKTLKELVKKRTEEDALSVIIARSPCRFVDRGRKSPPAYDEAKCRKCGLCIQIDCPALTKREDGFVELNAGMCTGCGLCADVCPFSALTKTENS